MRDTFHPPTAFESLLTGEISIVGYVKGMVCCKTCFGSIGQYSGMRLKPTSWLSKPACFQCCLEGCEGEMGRRRLRIHPEILMLSEGCSSRINEARHINPTSSRFVWKSMNPCYPFYVPEETDYKDSPPPYESCEPGMEMRNSAPSLFQYVWTR